MSELINPRELLPDTLFYMDEATGLYANVPEEARPDLSKIALFLGTVALMEEGTTAPIRSMRTETAEAINTAGLTALRDIAPFALKRVGADPRTPIAWAKRTRGDPLFRNAILEPLKNPPLTRGKITGLALQLANPDSLPEDLHTDKPDYPKFKWQEEPTQANAIGFLATGRIVSTMNNEEMFSVATPGILGIRLVREKQPTLDIRFGEMAIERNPGYVQGGTLLFKRL
jgi:hypothetical protein